MANIVNENIYDFATYSWIADSAATSHICAQWDTFTDYQSLPWTAIKGIDDRTVTTEEHGTVVLISCIDGAVSWTQLPEILYVPEM